jgi:acyl-CoA reductase-like NAD-dependent aldehyde dehydrogenase
MAHDPTSPRPLLIDGRPVQGSAAPLDCINPATGLLNHTVSAASAADVDQAVDAASRAARAPAWRNALPHERAALLLRMASLIERDAELLAKLQRLENGKVHAECVAQASHAAATFRYFAAVCESAVSEVTPPRGDYVSMTVHEPYGVVAAITPWNSPLSMEAQKVAPALAAGNAVILKPSELTPSTALELGRIAHEMCAARRWARWCRSRTATGWPAWWTKPAQRARTSSAAAAGPGRPRCSRARSTCPP